MEKKLIWHDAIYTRTSRRTYTGEPLEPDHFNALNQSISNINEESGLNFKLLKDSRQFFTKYKTSYGMFKNVQTVIALVGDPQKVADLEVQVGYYGEFLMLECVSRNLGTCWIGGTYDKKALEADLNLDAGEKLVAVIIVGPVESSKSLTEKLVSRIGKNKQTFEQLLQEKTEPIPSWVQSGIEAARLAPSAVNGKPIAYTYLNEMLTARITKKKYGMESLDLGISLAHFELGALKEGVTGKWISKDSEYTFKI